MTQGSSANIDPDETIARLLREAAGKLPESADLGRFGDYMKARMWPQAYEELRYAASEHPVPFAFWVEMSEAADLIGLD